MSTSQSASPVLPELNEFYRLTNEDHMIFRRRRVSVEQQGRYHKSDRQDAFQIRNRVNRARYGGISIASDGLPYSLAEG